MTAYVCRGIKLRRPPLQPLRSECEDIVSDTTCGREATMDGSGLLQVSGRNNKLKKRGENAPRPCIDRGGWRLGLQSRAGAT